MLKKYSWIIDYVLSLKGAKVNYQDTWECYRFEIGEKYFALLGDHEGEDFLTLKGDPDENENFRDLFSGIIIPGYYSNKKHWNTIRIAQDVVPKELVLDMLKKSYELVLKGMTKSKRELALLDLD